MKRRLAVLGIAGSLLLLAPALSAPIPALAATAPISFGKSLLAGETSTRPTSIQFGPDGRLYVLQQDGTLKIYAVGRNGPNDYRVQSTETVNLIKNIPNHDDNGAVNNTLGKRQATGMVVTGTAAQPVLYISSSDPRYGGGVRGDLNLDTNSGMVSRLTRSGTSWQKVDLVRGLPRSEENHSVNGLALDATTNTLYLAVGGHTNMGAPSYVFADLPEFALSAAILSINLSAIGSTTYDLPTLDDPAQPGVQDATDPFGGDDGANQAKIVAGGPVQVFAAGFRNPYDVLISSKGLMYTDDNGHNAGQGNVPIGEGPGGTCTNAVNDAGVTGPDSLHIVSAGYYGGHPNPTRGNKANTFHGESPIGAANPIECDYWLANSPGHPVLATDPSSSNGITEYTASNFGGAMKGDLLLAAYDNYVTRIDLDATGDRTSARRRSSRPSACTPSTSPPWETPRHSRGPSGWSTSGIRTSTCSSPPTSVAAGRLAREPITPTWTRTATGSTTPMRSTTAPTRARPPIVRTTGTETIPPTSTTRTTTTTASPTPRIRSRSTRRTGWGARCRSRTRSTMRRRRAVCSTSGSRASSRTGSTTTVRSTTRRN